MAWCSRRRRVLFFCVRTLVLTLASGGVVMLIRERATGGALRRDPRSNLPPGVTGHGEGAPPPAAFLHAGLHVHARSHTDKGGRVITALYRGLPTGDDDQDAAHGIIAGLLERKLMKHKFSLNMLVSGRDCRADGGWDVQPFHVLIIGGGSVLDHHTLCVLPRLNKVTVTFLAGSGYDDANMRLRDARHLKAFTEGDTGLLADKDVANAKALRGLASRKVIGGVRGPHSKRIVDYSLKKQKRPWSVPILGDILTIAGHFYAEDNETDFDVHAHLKLPRGEKYIVINLCRNATRTYERSPGKLMRELHVALVELNQRYHMVLYGLGKADVSHVTSFTNRLAKAAENPNYKVVALPGPPEVPALGHILRGAFLAVNCAVQANAISTAYGTPFVGIVQRLESLDLLDQLSLTANYAVALHRVRAALIVSKVNRVAHDEERLKERLRAHSAAVYGRYDKLFEALATNLTKAANARRTG